MSGTLIIVLWLSYSRQNILWCWSKCAWQTLILGVCACEHGSQFSQFNEVWSPLSSSPHPLPWVQGWLHVSNYRASPTPPLALVLGCTSSAPSPVPRQSGAYKLQIICHPLNLHIPNSTTVSISVIIYNCSTQNFPPDITLHGRGCYRVINWNWNNV